MLAGRHSEAGKLIVLYDDNGISIDGEVAEWFSDDTAKRFESYGWQVLAADGHDSAAIAAAIAAAQGEPDKPTLIGCKTVIGFGSPNKGGTAATHGAPLGGRSGGSARRAGLAPCAVCGAGRDRGCLGCHRKRLCGGVRLKEKLVAYEEEYPELAMELVRRIKGELPGEFSAKAERTFNSARKPRTTSPAARPPRTALKSLARCCLN